MRNSPNLTYKPFTELHPDLRRRQARVARGHRPAVLRHDQLPHVRGQAAARADHRQDQLEAVPEGVLSSDSGNTNNKTYRRFADCELCNIFSVYAIIFDNFAHIDEKKKEERKNYV